MTLAVAEKLGEVKDCLDEPADCRTVGATIFVDRMLTDTETRRIERRVQPQRIGPASGSAKAVIDL